MSSAENKKPESQLRIQTEAAFKYLHGLGTRLSEDESDGFETDTHSFEISSYLRITDKSPNYVKVRIDKLNSRHQTLYTVDKYGVVETKFINDDIRGINPENALEVLFPGADIMQLKAAQSIALSTFVKDQFSRKK